MNLNTAENNKKAFITRLIKAGWPRKEALAEWERIQSDEEADCDL